MIDIKRRKSLILGSAILVFGLAIGGTVLAGNQKSSASSDNAKTEIPVSEINLEVCDSYSSDEEKETAYENYVKDSLSSAVGDIDGISGCIIDITESNKRWSGADVCITVNDSLDAASEASIQDYVARALDVSAENVKISYK